MLWLCLHFPHLAIELRQPADPGAAAIAARIGSRRILIAANTEARAQNVGAGLDSISAVARIPELTLIERAPGAEKRALRALAVWSEQFSSEICLDAERWMLWLEAGASLHYFGGFEAFIAAIRKGLTALGYTVSAGIAPTLEAAALLAHPKLDSNNRIVHTRKALLSALSPLPAQLLALSPEAHAGLRDSGLTTIGAVLAVPAAALARRFGPELTGYLQRLTGAAADPRVFHKPARNYRRRFEFVEPIESLEGLLFPLRRVFFEFQGFLRARDTAVQSLRLQLLHRDAPPTILELRTTDPERRALRLFALLREKLERVTLPEPTCEIRLEADQFIAPGDTQLSLFEDRAQRDSNWSALLDKLRARLGDSAVRRLGLHADHRPERAWCIQTERIQTKNGEPPLPESFPDRPLWILEPRPIRHLPKIIGHPERIETGWWDAAEARRDYYIAETDEGARWWLYRDAITHEWFLQGLWA